MPWPGPATAGPAASLEEPAAEEEDAEPRGLLAKPPPCLTMAKVPCDLWKICCRTLCIEMAAAAAEAAEAGMCTHTWQITDHALERAGMDVKHT